MSIFWDHADWEGIPEELGCMIHKIPLSFYESQTSFPKRGIRKELIEQISPKNT